MEQVEAAIAARRLADAQVIRAVRAARDAGVSWADIGRAFAISRQAAWERFANRISECRHCQGDPPLGHVCPRCGRVTPE